MKYLNQLVLGLACFVVACAGPAPVQGAGGASMADIHPMVAPTVASSSSSGSSGTFWKEQVKRREPIVSLLAEKAWSTGVKKEQHVTVLYITIATGSEPIIFHGLPLIGQAKVEKCAFGQPCARRLFAQRVTSLRVEYLGAELGIARAPDTETGRTFIDCRNIALPAYAKQLFIVKASFASSASSGSEHDEIAVGLLDPPSMQGMQFAYGQWMPAEQSVQAEVTSSLRDQLGAHPRQTHTVRKSGLLNIQAAAPLPFNMHMIGKEAWIPLARYAATVRYEASSLDRLSVELGSSLPQDRLRPEIEIAVALNNQIRGTTSILNRAGHADVDLSEHPILIPDGDSVYFEIWVKGGTRVPFDRFDHLPTMRIADGIISGEWDPEYAGMLNVRTTGRISGERLFVPKEQHAPKGMTL